MHETAPASLRLPQVVDLKVVVTAAAECDEKCHLKPWLRRTRVVQLHRSTGLLWCVSASTTLLWNFNATQFSEHNITHSAIYVFTPKTLKPFKTARAGSWRWAKYSASGDHIAKMAYHQCQGQVYHQSWHVS